MKFTCNRDIFIEALNAVQRIIPSKSNTPVLEGFLIEVGEDIIITGSDGEVSITFEVAAIIEEIGSVVVSAKIFGDIVRKMPDVYVTVETSSKNNSLLVNSGASQFEIPTISSDSYPKISYIDNSENNFSMPAAEFRKCIRQSAFAASIEGTKQILKGVLIENADGVMKFAAVDGVKMAVKKFVSGLDKEFRVVVNARIVSEVEKILEKSDELVDICFTDSQIMFSNKNFRFVSNLLKGDFPDYEKLIPTDFSTEMKVKTYDFVSTFERVGLVISDEKKWPIVLKTYPDEVFISVVGENGNSNETVSAEISGQEIEIFFNRKVMSDCLKVIDKEKMTVKFSTQKGPCVIIPEDDETFIMLVMPVKPRIR